MMLFLKNVENWRQWPSLLIMVLEKGRAEPWHVVCSLSRDGLRVYRCTHIT